MQTWLPNLDQDTAVIVPTRSLANSLSEQLAANHLEHGHTVWEVPNILLWTDYLKLLWQQNREVLATASNARTLITTQQSLLLWTQIIEASRRDEQALTLLNVQQTAKAVQRSWRLMHDWQVDIEVLANDHVADIQQFIVWLESYQNLLQKRGLLDESLLAKQLLINSSSLKLPFKKIIWHCYDLITTSQQQFNQFASEQGVKVDFQDQSAGHKQVVLYHSYESQKQELLAVFQAARDLIERNGDALINIVIPDLQHRQAQVSELAREVFYPAMSPLELQQSNSVYRFSLGQPLKQWPAIETALTLFGLLKNRVKVPDLSFLLRNLFLRHCQKHVNECRFFDRWLKQQRISNVRVDQLADLYQQCIDHGLKRDKPIASTDLLEFLRSIEQQRDAIQHKLTEAKSDSGFAALSFSEWGEHISEWLNVWGWSTSIAQSDMSSVQFQLGQRWQSLLQEYADLSAVQNSVGINRALEILHQMSHDAVFLPKAPASPILISGVYEAIGRPVTHCYLTGMDDQYPQAAQADSFVSNRLLLESDYPQASSEGSYQQAKKVIDGLLASAQNVTISYAQQTQQDRETMRMQTALFRDQKFIQQTETEPQPQNIELEPYQDIAGSAWPSDTPVEGGTMIFTNQSNCAFKAFVTHQLKYDRDDEAEFGLDSLDHGNIVHILLDKIWGQIHTQAELKALDAEARKDLISETIEFVLSDPELNLSEDKKKLLQHEKPRLLTLLNDWLDVDAARPTAFSVTGREQAGVADFAGIGFRYTIDRLDMLDDGRVVIIDYKTGQVAKRDWMGDRLRQPQLPLYALTHDMKKRTAASGIAYASVKQHESKYEPLSEAGIFKSNRHADKVEVEWHDSRAAWPQLLTQLAEDFLAGQAVVNPIDEKTCQYCDLTPVCRVSQLRQNDSIEKGCVGND